MACVAPRRQVNNGALRRAEISKTFKAKAKNGKKVHSSSDFSVEALGVSLTAATLLVCAHTVGQII